jgi:hypothetical protein
MVPTMAKVIQARHRLPTAAGASVTAMRGCVPQYPKTDDNHDQAEDHECPTSDRQRVKDRMAESHPVPAVDRASTKPPRITAPPPNACLSGGT